MSQRKLPRLLVCIQLLVCSLFTSLSYGDALIDDIRSQPQQLQRDYAISKLAQPLSEPQQLAVNAFIAKQFFEDSNYEKAARYYLRAEQLAAKHGTVIEHSRYAQMQGVSHYYRGQDLTAIEDYLRAIEIIEQIDKPIIAAHLYNNIGLAYSGADQIEAAIASYSKAKELYDEYGDEYDQVNIMHNIAVAYMDWYRFEAAFDIYEQIGDSFERLGDTIGQAQMETNLGSIYQSRMDFEQAEIYYQKALVKYQENGDRPNHIVNLIRLAELNFVQGRFDAAYTQMRDAQAQAEVMDNLHYNSNIKEIEAKLLFAKGQYKQAQRALREVYIMREQVTDDKASPAISLIELLVTAAQGDHVKSALLYERYERQQQEMLSNKIASSLNDFQAKYNATELQQQVDSLKQQQQLDKLEAQQRRQMTFLAAGILILAFISIVLLFRRSAERKATAMLEDKVKQRTKELEELADQLSAANEIKSQFLANISHEIRTPLTSIMGQAQAIIEGDVPAEQVAKELRVIYNNSQHLGELINDVLDLSKIEANKLELVISTVSICSLLADINAMFQPSASQKGILFRINNKLPASFGAEFDYIRVKQVLVNLCSNAVKFTEQGEVELAITADEQGVCFRVKDTGIGIAEDKLDAIFANFSQGDNSISRRFGGTGLGLSLSQQLAQIMGGDISVSSVLGQGSTFSFYIPCRCMEMDERSNDTIQAARALSFSGEVVLAEDHEDNRRLIERLLTNLGIKVHSAANGEQAVELTLQHCPDLVLMDIQMPKMDGLEALNLLRQCGYTQPIIALTANAMTHDIERYKAAGFTNHLAKPIEKEEFCRTLEHFLNVEIDARAAQSVDMSDLHESFMHTLPREIESLVNAHARNDLDEIKAVAHRLAGAAQMFASQTIAELVCDIELAAKYQDKEQVGVLIEDLANLELK